jgi:hypothetical protein
MFIRVYSSTVLFGSAALLLGCSGTPGRIATPGIDAQDAAQAALTLYDRDGDSQLNNEELKASPPLINARAAYDTDRDGSLTREELVAGIESWKRRGIGAMPLPFTVRLDGRPLQGAEVKLRPAPFLSDAIAPAGGTTDATGSGSLQISGVRPANLPPNLPVIQPGLYLVEISHPTIAIPEVYNRTSTLGLEAGIAGQDPSGVIWELSSKKKHPLAPN